MRLDIYCTKDLVKDRFEMLFPAETEGQAWREFHQRIAQDQYAKEHTEEFLLFRIGQFDFTTGEFKQIATEPQLLYQTMEEEIEKTGKPF